MTLANLVADGRAGWSVQNWEPSVDEVRRIGGLRMECWELINGGTVGEKSARRRNERIF
ncbi:hypothetical protein BCR34DRAFT_556576 [Clohesyomyces aquaticus]|uniref:Uncharacterized protein n=1 Tax=Clohesyomyces aquaticus TaxID=1231657 RepID=A0A1Y2A423_9PLEO|nr:hypothetical protein BCR34DRAFT_556576 [Clohesyomyces aquaticus]